MRLINGFCVREILDEIVAIPTGEASRVFSGIISLNEVSKFLFEALSSEQTVESLVKSLMDEYEVDEQTANRDIMEFLENLRKNHLLTEG